MNIQRPGGIGNFASAMSRLAARHSFEPFARGADFASALSGAASDVTVNISPEYQALINKQMEVQAEVQQVTFMSNIERANHESRMAPVRNMRVA